MGFGPVLADSGESIRKLRLVLDWLLSERMGNSKPG